MNMLSCARAEDQQLGVGLSSGGRSQADGVPKRLQTIEASPRKPCPETSKRGSVEAQKEIRVATSGVAEGMPQPMTQEFPKPKRRQFKITRKLLEKHGYQSECSGCDAVLKAADRSRCETPS